MANTAEDLLVDSFQFKIPPGASYVTDRRTISYMTAGSNGCRGAEVTKKSRFLDLLLSSLADAYFYN